MLKGHKSILFFPVWMIAAGIPVLLAASGQPDSDPLFPEVKEIRDNIAELRLQWQMEGIKAAIEDGFTGVASILTETLLQQSPEGPQLESLLASRFHIALVRGDLSAAAETRERMVAQGFAPQALEDAFYRYFTNELTGLESLPPDPGQFEPDPDASAWFRLLEALILSREGRTESANVKFEEAAALASNNLIRNQFEIIRYREELSRGLHDDVTISALRESVRSMRGERGGFEAARLLAIALDRSGQSPAAIEVLNTHLSMPGLREYNLRAEFLLLMGIIAGPESSRGRLALRQIVSEAGPAEEQAIALALLAQESFTAQLRDSLLEDIRTWLDQEPPSPLSDLMLVYQAYFLAQKGDFQSAGESARRLSEQFPLSTYQDTALWLLAYTSWNQTPPRYRTAADYLNQLRQRLEDPQRQLITGILIADCYFLNGDFASASDAYGAVLRLAGEDSASRVFLQRILSEISADRPASAGELIDQARSDPRLDEDVIWKAEWNLLDYLRSEGRTDLAFERIGRVLQPLEGNALLPQTLVLRFRWLEARLTLEAGSAAEAAQRSEALLEDLSGEAYAEVDSALLEAVESHLLLLLGEARIVDGQKDAAIESFTRLRESFPQSGPAILSYLVESRSESAADNLVNAQQSLVGLVDRFPRSEYAPIALWEAALNAEQRGLNIHLQEAIGILERLVTEYPGHELVYYARLKQGDLARRLNDFPTALLLYERILSQYPDHPERYRAEISRADCLMALGSEDPARFDMAAVVYERNCLLPTAPLPIRVEAGFKWGHSLRQLGDMEGFEAVFWLLYERFVKDPEVIRTVLNDEVGRYWISRILFDLADFQVQKGEVAKGRQIYETILAMELPGAAVAETRIGTLP